MLCDRLIYGINDARSLECSVDYFDKAFKLVQTSESADKSLQNMEKATAVEFIMSLRPPSLPVSKQNATDVVGNIALPRADTVLRTAITVGRKKDHISRI